MKKDLITRLNEGPVICAEGYLFAMERRGYLSAGGFVPTVVLENPDVVTQLHREFIRAGSDVVQAFTYYGHREKLRIIGKEDLLEPMQKNALKIAKDAAAEFKDLDLMVCGDVANTNIFDPNDKSTFKECQKMYEEQVRWAKEAGVDFIVAETINWVDEMKIALKAIKDEGLIAVANYAIPRGDLTRDGYTAGDASNQKTGGAAALDGTNPTGSFSHGGERTQPCGNSSCSGCTGPNGYDYGGGGSAGTSSGALYGETAYHGGYGGRGYVVWNFAESS